MRLVFWVNDVREVAAKQTTAMLIGSAAARGHEVTLCSVRDLSLDRSRVVARGARVSAPGDPAPSP